MALKIHPKSYVGNDGRSQLLIYYRLGRDRVFFKNDIKVYPEYWLGEYVSNKHPHHSRINGSIVAHTDRAQDIINTVVRKGLPITPKNIKDVIEQSKVETDLLSVAQKYALEYKKTHPSRSSDQIDAMVKKIEKWYELEGPMDFNQVDRSWIRNFAHILITDTQYVRYDEPLYNIGVKYWFNKFCTMMKWSFKEGYHKNKIYEDVPHIIKDYKVIDPIKPTVKMDVVAQIYKFDVNKIVDFSRNLIIDVAEMNKDAFVFMTQTGPRISDIESLRVSDIIEKDGKYYIAHKITKKRKKRVVIMLNKIATDIYEKWKDYKPETGLLFPLVTNYHMNRTVKCICAKLEFDRTILKEQMRGPSMVTKETRFCDEISSHFARHTFALNFMNRGGRIYALQQILGHGSVTTTEKYLKTLEGYVVDTDKISLSEEEMVLFA